MLGYTIGNDVSERTWQASDRTMWRAKNTDTFKPMGPWIETDADLDSMRTTVRLNGETVLNFATNDMVFGVETYISAMSRYLTLYPGDVIWMGTDGASENLKTRRRRRNRNHRRRHPLQPRGQAVGTQFQMSSSPPGGRGLR